MSAPSQNACPPRLIIKDLKRIGRGKLLASVSVQLPNGLTVHEVGIFGSDGRAWASLPAKPMIGRDGQPIRDKTTGKARYIPLVTWPDRQTSDRFSEAVIAAVEAQHPGVVR